MGSPGAEAGDWGHWEWHWGAQGGPDPSSRSVPAPAMAVSPCVPQAPAPLSTAPWAPRCCCRARGVRPSGAGGAPCWARPLPRGWPCPTPAWPTRATTAATTLSPARPGPPSACGWAVSDPPALPCPCCWPGVPGGAGSGVIPVPCPRPTPATGHRVLGHQLPAGCELLLGAEPRPPAGHRLRGHLQVSGGPQSLPCHPALAQLSPPCHPALGCCPCVPRHGTDTGECTLTGPRSCSFGDLQVFSLTPYELNVTARNPLGAASGILPFLLENISECCGMGDSGVPCGTLVSRPGVSFGALPCLGCGIISAMICWGSEHHCTAHRGTRGHCPQ